MRVAVVVSVFVLAACGGPARKEAVSAPVTREPFRSATIRQPALFVRVEVGAGPWDERRRASLPGEYEGALVEALNARAVPIRDVQVVPSRERLDRKVAVTRAREVGADHALVVEADVRVAEVVFCGDTRRPFRARTTVWRQRLVVLRANDGAMAFETDAPLEVPGLDPDCDTPRESRTRSAADQLSHAVDTLLARLLGR